jgi:hypothetical protein
VHQLLGETYPPDMVISFSWRDHLLPGACSLTFAPEGENFRYISLGQTQPLNGEEAFSWEFSLRTPDDAAWPSDLLYQLVTQWLVDPKSIAVGVHFPLVFFKDPKAQLWAGIIDDTTSFNVVGEIRGLYLWPDDRGLRFFTSDGAFRLLSVIAVPADEDRLVRETSPAHLVLLLHCMGVGQVCDPRRRSALTLPRAGQQWDRIKQLSHEEVLGELGRLPQKQDL